ncbi:hypothetical protein [Ktedonospora formicarum]|uniref:Uncharacterized protein n=1 Tax=Ktedonospora formicarum TaxID=2778364 RepID=A0A8J3I6P9_9CHLR|nr:hypothetical protein [Ktedonospora formicarum]GHO48113.1 hypothetical protein KSX_62760 [Ktedonospora formicarum]
MLRQRRTWHAALVALILSLALLLNTSIITQASTHLPTASCRVTPNKPVLMQGQLVGIGSMKCDGPVSDLQVTSRIEVNVGGSWYKVSESSTSGPSNAQGLNAIASVACTQGQTMTFRGVASGNYQEKNDYRQVPASASSEVVIKCPASGQSSESTL